MTNEQKAELFDMIIKHLRIQGYAINYIDNYLNIDDETSKENNKIAEIIKEINHEE